MDEVDYLTLQVILDTSAVMANYGLGKGRLLQGQYSTVKQYCTVPATVYVTYVISSCIVAVSL